MEAPKKCPGCGMYLPGSYSYCYNCGTKLLNPNETFLRTVKERKKNFLAECETFAREMDARKLGEAAWYIAKHSPEKQEYFEGSKIASRQSYRVLDSLVEDAVEIFHMLLEIRKTYDCCLGAETIRTDDKVTYVFTRK